MTRAPGGEDPLAIVGIGCRLPGATDALGYWNLLTSGTDAVTETPKDRWGLDRLSDPGQGWPGAAANRWGGYLDSVTGFDWRAFRISPRKAKLMDPQQRLLLEVAWEAFEDAGIPADRLSDSDTAVYVGIMWNDYAKLAARDYSRIEGYHANANSFAYAANRISYFFNLNGPSVAIDLQCASSLAAVHMACRSIWDGEASLALAGGVNLILSPDTNLAMAKAGILSPTGRCKTWDTSADGFVRGEGCGLIVIKPVARALADNDRIYAVIRSSVLTHAGKTDWIMQPSIPGQEALLRRAYAKAGVDVREVDYVELHGTGTRIGDPIEAAALGSVVGQARLGEPCRVGSAKTNIGHLDSAAGIAGLIKTALAVYHAQIPPSLHLSEVNPAIPLAELGLTVQTELSPWPVTGHQRTAGVTALSFGGGQCHVVLTQAPEPAAGPPCEPPKRYVIPLSASSDDALRLQASSLARYLTSADPPADLTDVCYTAAMRRSVLNRRAAVIARSSQEAARRLLAFAESRPEEGVYASAPEADIPPVVFLFSHVLESEQLVRRLSGRPGPFGDYLAQLDRIVRQETGIRLLGDDGALPMPDGHARKFLTTLALQVGLAGIVQSWGVRPTALFGAGIGEVSALLAAGWLTPAEAVRAAVRLANLNARPEEQRAGAPSQQPSLMRLVAGASKGSPETRPPVFTARLDGRAGLGLEAALEGVLPEAASLREAETVFGQGAAGPGVAMVHFGPSLVWDTVLHVTNPSPAAQIGALQADELDDACLASVAAFAFARGASVDWSHVLPPGQLTSLPHRSWKREHLAMAVSGLPEQRPERAGLVLPPPVPSGDHGGWRWEIALGDITSDHFHREFYGGMAGIFIQIIRSCVDFAKGWEPFALQGFAISRPLDGGDESPVEISLAELYDGVQFEAYRRTESGAAETVCSAYIGPAVAEPRRPPTLTNDLTSNGRSAFPAGSGNGLQVTAKRQDERNAIAWTSWTQEAPRSLTESIGPAYTALAAEFGLPGAELVRAREIYVNPRTGASAIVHWQLNGLEDEILRADVTLTDQRGNVIVKILGGEFSDSSALPSPSATDGIA